MSAMVVVCGAGSIVAEGRFVYNAKLHYNALLNRKPLLTSLTVTARGQVTFRKDVLQHLGVQPGGKIHLDLLPDGRAELTAEPQSRSFRELHGFLKDKTNGARLSLDDVADAIAESGSEAGAGNP